MAAPARLPSAGDASALSGVWQIVECFRSNFISKATNANFVTTLTATRALQYKSSRSETSIYPSSLNPRPQNF
jgi:hypothetical protein